jgi:paraquat-inducible protein A
MVDGRSKYPIDSAANSGLANCSLCHLVSPVTEEHCPRCNTGLHLRNRNSVQVTLALVITAMLFYIPANIFPIMSSTLLGNKTDSTIIGGVVLFLDHGSYFIAIVIFTASVIIPMAKMAAIVWLCISVNSNKKLNHQDLTRMYRMTEFIGKWSMIDVFVVAILVALVQLSGLMAIKPGIAVSAFTAVVILTMIAAHQFDLRLIWDKLEAV